MRFPRFGIGWPSAVAALLMSALFAGLIGGGSAAIASATAGAPVPASVGKFLAPDGRLDLEAIRASGLQGSLDLGGFDVRMGRESGPPTARALGAGQALDDPDDAYWADGFGAQGVNAPVSAMAVHDGKLIAAGQFTIAGGITANRIAAWDGSRWWPLGAGVGDRSYTRVHALTVYDGDLIVAGNFNTAGGVAMDCIAAWDGSNWSPLGSGITTSGGVGVRALAVHEGKLIASGYFSNAGGTPADFIAAWDGTNWSALGSGLDYYAYALIEYGGQLIAGGEFTTAGGVPVESIAAWDGATWSSVGTGIHIGRVNVLAVYNGLLIAGGVFESAGGVPANNVAAWNGSNWAALGSGLSEEVMAFTSYNGFLVAGGDFAVEGDRGSSHIAPPAGGAGRPSRADPSTHSRCSTRRCSWAARSPRSVRTRTSPRSTSRHGRASSAACRSGAHFRPGA
jgi:hypothetical protein